MDKAKVIEYHPGWGGATQFGVAFPVDGKFEFRGGVVYRTREAAEAALPKEIAYNDRYWAGQLARRDNAIVVDHVHYRIGDATRPVDIRGHGGRTFRIEDLATGEITVTTDLWYQGPMPDYLRDQFPNTHKFV